MVKASPNAIARKSAQKVIVTWIGTGPPDQACGT